MFAVLRFAVLAVAVALAVCLLAWLLTGERKWLHYAVRIFKYATYALVFVLLLFAGEALFRQG